MKAKKSYGQHFLNKESIALDIALGLKSTDQYQQIVEIGPGQGMLTKHLMEQYPNHKFHVIEADQDMVHYLTKHYPELFPHIIAEDFLKVHLQDHFQEPFAIIGNFPYNISSQILFKLVENRQNVPELVGMFQKEVAERVAAEPNSKAYGVLTVLIQAYYETEYLFTVAPEHFNPPPKVQSGVIRLTRKPNFENLGCDERRFRTMVKVAFGTRRKMLRNSLKQFFPKDVLFEDPFFQQRPENLSISDFVALTQRASQYL